MKKLELKKNVNYEVKPIVRISTESSKIITELAMLTGMSKSAIVNEMIEYASKNIVITEETVYKANFKQEEDD